MRGPEDGSTQSAFLSLQAGAATVDTVCLSLHHTTAGAAVRGGVGGVAVQLVERRSTDTVSEAKTGDVGSVRPGQFTADLGDELADVRAEGEEAVPSDVGAAGAAEVVGGELPVICLAGIVVGAEQ